MRDLIFKGKNRYKDFLDGGEGISTNILADRLGQLENLKLIEKFDDPENGRQYVYIPTKKGLDLIPVLLEMVRWSATYDAKTEAPQEFITQLNKDQGKLAMEVRKKVLNSITLFKKGVR